MDGWGRSRSDLGLGWSSAYLRNRAIITPARNKNITKLEKARELATAIFQKSSLDY